MDRLALPFTLCLAIVTWRLLIYAGTRCQSSSTSNLIFNNRCYVKYENESLTWYQARERCINNGGDLAQFQNRSNPWIPPFDTSWLDQSLTYWVGIRWNDWSWKSSGTLSTFCVYFILANFYSMDKKFRNLLLVSLLICWNRLTIIIIFI